MRVTQFLPLAPLVCAFVVPNQEIFQQLATSTKKELSWFDTTVKSGLTDVSNDATGLTNKIKSKVASAQKSAVGTLDDALAFAHDAGRSMTEDIFDAKSWISNNVEHLYEAEHGVNWRSDRDQTRPHDGRGPPNQTVYELIASSKYTTKLAALVNEFPDLVEALNGTNTNYTVFAPSDRAFERIREHAPKPSKEQLKKILSYHVSDSFYPAGRVLSTHTIPTLLTGEELSEDPVAQRLSVNIGLRGLTVDFYSRIIAIDIFGTNGVIHGLDSVLLPPPRTLKIIDLLPGKFSTLELGLTKTGLLDELAKDNSKGGTLFAPSNFAFEKLGARANAFLFSKYGQKYLKALLKYHIVPEITLYSDAVYEPKDKTSVQDSDAARGLYHFDLPTLLEDRHLSVDVARYGGFISIKVNGFGRVSVQDGIAKDGVIQVVGDVLIPPKRYLGAEEVDFRGEIEVEELKARLEPYL